MIFVKDDCKRKRIQTELESDREQAMIRGDRGKLKQVFLNLVKNATEAMERGGHLSVRSQRAGDLVEITITDDGCGIPKEEQEKIFSPFFTTKRQGSGLGLSVSKSIIEEHVGSSFSVESEEGKGTTFRVRMPLSGQIKEDKKEKGGTD